MIDYSQHGEQDAILAWASDRIGSFVDFGAWDGESLSNTAALAELGWAGICIEAAPDGAARCASRYASRDDITVIAGALLADSDTSPVITLHWSPGTVYSALTPNQRPDISLVPITVPVIDRQWLAATISALPQPLFASIDLEGHSLPVLRWLLANTHPGCVCVEANNPDDQARVAVLTDGWQELLNNGRNVVVAAP